MAGQWTPGKWSADESGVYSNCGGGDIVCLSPNMELSLEYWPANQLLISAAPDLYKALADAPILSKYHGVGGFEVARFISDYEAWRTSARAALAKAGAL